MKISTRGSYAIEAMVELGYQNKCCSIASIARSRDCSLKYLEHIFRDLKKAGLIKSIRGKTGGYVLAKDALYISCKDIILAVETKSDNALDTPLQINPVFDDIQKEIYALLDAICLNSLVQNYKKELSNELIYEI